MKAPATILAVDGCPALLANPELILVAAGYRVLTGSDSVRALSLLESQSVDLVLTESWPRPAPNKAKEDEPVMAKVMGERQRVWRPVACWWTTPTGAGRPALNGRLPGGRGGTGSMRRWER